MVLVGYGQREVPKCAYDSVDKYGRKKSKGDLENEALEEPFVTALTRYVLRASFLCEAMALLTGVLLSVKCLARLNVEIGIYGESVPQHPVFWVALGLTALFSLLESAYVNSIQKLAGELGRQQRLEVGETWVDQLAVPLLSRITPEDDVENGSNNGSGGADEASVTVVSTQSTIIDIGADAETRASWRDLIAVVEPDKIMIAVAFVFLILSSVCQVLVPKFTGAVLDSLVHQMNDKGNMTSSTMGFRAEDDGYIGNGSLVRIPGFTKNIELLVSVALLGGVFGGLRGSIFTVRRLLVRLRCDGWHRTDY